MRQGPESGGWGPGGRGWGLGVGGWGLRFAACAVVVVGCGCGRYADFSLPLLTGGDARASYTFEPRPQPVLSPGAGWESNDVLNPSVVASPTPNPQPLTPGFQLLYSAFDGRTWHTGLASSEDGFQWRKRGKVLSPDPHTWEGSYIAANGSALVLGKEIWYWYVAGTEEKPLLGLARSSDGLAWRKEPAPVLQTGPYASWDEQGVADPYVIRIDPYFYLYYLGQDRARRQRLGVARSPDGIHWEKLRANPILELGDPGAFDEAGLGEPAVWSARGFYWMLYTGLDPGINRKLGLARSTDGVVWEKRPPVFGGPAAWDSKVICDPTVLPDGENVRVWFGGGDVASRDSHLHGQIGVGVLRPSLTPTTH